MNEQVKRIALAVSLTALIFALGMFTVLSMTDPTPANIYSLCTSLILYYICLEKVEPRQDAA